MQIFSFSNRPPIKFEVMDPDSLVESIGYVPIRKRIEEMQLAGYRLQGYREGLYDKTDDIDPIRKPGLDLADITQLAREVGRRLGQAQKAKLEAEKQKVAAEGSSSGSPQTPGGEGSPPSPPSS